MTVPAVGFFIGLEPRFQVFDAPGLFDSVEHAQRVFSDPDVQKRLATFGATKGVEPLFTFANGPLMLLSHRPVRGIDDLKGQKIRVMASPVMVKTQTLLHRGQPNLRGLSYQQQADYSVHRQRCALGVPLSKSRVRTFSPDAHST